MYACMDVCMYVCMYGMHGMRGMHRMHRMHGIHDMVWYGMAWYVCTYISKHFQSRIIFFERLDSNAMNIARKNTPRTRKHELGSNNVNMERQ